jgi:CheY-like chemotaxis protein
MGVPQPSIFGTKIEPQMKKIQDGKILNTPKQVDAKETSHPTATEAYRILVVDDEALVRWSLTEVLRKAKYSVSTANSAEDALVHLRAEHVDVLITDLKMPGESGFELAARTKQIQPHCHVIMMTAFGEDASEERAKRSGVEWLIDKPVNLPEVIWLIKRMMS